MKPLAVFVAAVLTASAVVGGPARSEPRETAPEQGAGAAQKDAKPAASRPDARERDPARATRHAVRVILASPYAQPK